MEDTLTIATAEGVRIYAITTKNLVQEAADRHHTSHLATGRARQSHERCFNACRNNERRRTYSFKTERRRPYG